MKLTFYGAAQTVTGSCYLIENRGRRLLVDCGLFQGPKTLKQLNYMDFPFDPRGIDQVLLTHAHIDHSGLIPKLYKKGFRGEVWATGATVELCTALLPDSGYIQEMEVERKNRKGLRAGRELLEAIYTAKDAENCLDLFHPISYEKELASGAGIKVVFHDAGHILGSAMLEVIVEEVDGQSSTLLFSGDIGNLDRPIVNDPYRPLHSDYVIMESTYGDRVREDRGDEVKQLTDVLREAFKRGGNVIIPAFAVERTQDLIYNLGQIIASGAVKPSAIYIDSPLAIKVTEIFCQNADSFDDRARKLQEALGSCPLYVPGLRYSQTTEESVALNRIKGGAVIISASGMCDAGRIKHHLKHNLWRPECTILFVGYQAKGTLGRTLLEGAVKVRIHGEEVSVRAKIANIEGFSSHADLTGLLSWASSFNLPPRMAFITHGEPSASQNLASLIKMKLGWQAVVPDRLSTMELTATLTARKSPAGVPPDLTTAEQLVAQEQLMLFKEELDRYVTDQVRAGKTASLDVILRRLREDLTGSST